MRERAAVGCGLWRVGRKKRARMAAAPTLTLPRYRKGGDQSRANGLRPTVNGQRARSAAALLAVNPQPSTLNARSA
jgi:hypothetical protein